MRILLTSFKGGCWDMLGLGFEVFLQSPLRRSQGCVGLRLEVKRGMFRVEGKTQLPGMA